MFTKLAFQISCLIMVATSVTCQDGATLLSGEERSSVLSRALCQDISEESACRFCVLGIQSCCNELVSFNNCIHRLQESLLLEVEAERDGPRSTVDKRTKFFLGKRPKFLGKRSMPIRSN